LLCDCCAIPRLAQVAQYCAVSGSRAVAKFCGFVQTFKKQCVLIFSPEFPNLPFHISASMANNNSESESVNNLEIYHSEIDLTEAYNSTLPEYLTSLFDREILWCNPAALLANQKTLRQFQGTNAASLSDPNELDRRCEILTRNESLTEYEYQGFRWFFDEDARIYRRKGMQFVGSFKTISNFYGEKCYHQSQ